MKKIIAILILCLIALSGVMALDIELTQKEKTALTNLGFNRDLNYRVIANRNNYYLINLNQPNVYSDNFKIWKYEYYCPDLIDYCIYYEGEQMRINESKFIYRRLTRNELYDSLKYQIRNKLKMVARGYYRSFNNTIDLDDGGVNI